MSAETGSTFKAEHAFTGASAVPLSNILAAHHESIWPFRTRESITAPEQLYQIVSIVLAYGDAYFGGKGTVRGSLLRDCTAHKFGDPVRRYAINRLLRSYLQQIYRPLEELPHSISDTFYDLLEGPDIDIKLPLTHHNKLKQVVFGSEPDKFFDSVASVLLPYICYAQTNPQIWRLNQIIHQDVRNLARSVKYGLKPPSFVQYFNEHVQLEDAASLGFDFAARLDVEAAIPPRKEHDWNRFTPFADPPSLLMYARRSVARGRIHMVRVGIAADTRRDPRSKVLTNEDIHTIATIDFIESLPEHESTAIDARSGTAVTTYDMQRGSLRFIPTVRTNSLLYKLGRALYGDVDVPTGTAPIIHVVIPSEVLNTYAKPVDFGPDWEKRNPSDALEIASRALWQAIDAEIDGTPAHPYITDVTLQRIAKHLKTISSIHYDDLSNFHKESLRKTFLISLLASPHRGVEYFGKAGIWTILMRKYPTLPAWETVLTELNKIISCKEYMQRITEDPRQHPHISDFTPGWVLIDHVLDLQGIFPDTNTYLERLYSLTTL